MTALAEATAIAPHGVLARLSAYPARCIDASLPWNRTRAELQTRNERTLEGRPGLCDPA